MKSPESAPVERIANETQESLDAIFQEAGIEERYTLKEIQHGVIDTGLRNEINTILTERDTENELAKKSALSKRFAFIVSSAIVRPIYDGSEIKKDTPDFPLPQ